VLLRPLALRPKSQIVPSGVLLKRFQIVMRFVAAVVFCAAMH